MMPCYFCKVYSDSLTTKLLVYINDILYVGTSDVVLKQSKQSLTACFDVGFLGQTHWYLST